MFGRTIVMLLLLWKQVIYTLTIKCAMKISNNPNAGSIYLTKRSWHTVPVALVNNFSHTLNASCNNQWKCDLKHNDIVYSDRLYAQDSVNSVRLVELRVPTHEREGGKALLGCQYDMEGDTLYSVKWYKENREFYRYMPKNDPPVYYFTTLGVNVDISRSSNTVVALVNLTQESAGKYSCEVSGEAPNFTTVSRQKNIFIHLLPKTGPRLTGLQKQYNIDDMVVANCSLPPSRPKAHLKWLVNDKPASQSDVLGPWYRVSAERPDAAETILQLSFRATTEHFVDGAIKLKCQATIAPLYQRETESTHYIALPIDMGTNADTSDAQKASLATDDAESSEKSIAAVIISTLFLLLA